jgi:hypothetical protein
LISNNPAFLAIAETYFETYWNSGKDKAKNRLTVLHA